MDGRSPTRPKAFGLIHGVRFVRWASDAVDNEPSVVLSAQKTFALEPFLQVIRLHTDCHLT